MKRYPLLRLPALAPPRGGDLPHVLAAVLGRDTDAILV
jgi:hypothetical protein